jgi:two-component system, sensor histidine kinase and response regulator
MTEADNENSRLAEEALRESEERLDFVLKGSQLGFWDWNLETNEVKRNERWAEMLGYKLHEIEFTVKQWLHFIHPDDRAIADQSIQDHLAGRTPMHQVEYRMLAKDGHCVWILDQAKVVKRDHRGRPLRMSGTHTDITERKQAEEQILRNELRLRKLVDILQYPSESIQGFLDYALEQAIELTESKIGYIYHYHEDRKEFVLNTWSRGVMAACAVTDPSTRYDLDKTGIWGEAVRQRRPIIVNDYQAANPLKKGCPEGHVPLLKFMTVPIFKNDGIVGVIGLANKDAGYEQTDILQVTLLMEAVWKVIERKQTEEELLREKHFLKTLLNSLPGIFYLYSYPELRLINWNKNHETLLGFGPGEITDCSILDFHPPEVKEAVLEAVEMVMEKGHNMIESPLLAKDGRLVPFILTGDRLEVSGQKYLMGVGIDITERIRAEEELLHINETLEQRVALSVENNMAQERMLIRQNRLAGMGEMVGNIAHQWRQPLNALGLLLFNIKDAYQFNTLDAAYLDQAVADGNRLVQKMSTTISDFSNFFRPDKEKCAFSALGQIREAISLVESSFQHGNISIHIDAPHDFKLLGFPNEYSQVLLNLLSNAKEAILARSQPQFSGPGRVDIALSEHNGQGIVTVTDNGGGIPAEVLDRIFDPYFSTKKNGSGIGLYMSKMIIERNMNGSITARIIEGGAEFRVCVPLAMDGL